MAKPRVMTTKAPPPPRAPRAVSARSSATRTAKSLLKLPTRISQSEAKYGLPPDIPYGPGGRGTMVPNRANSAGRSFAYNNLTGGRGSMLPNQGEKAAYYGEVAKILGPGFLSAYNNFATPGELEALLPPSPGDDYGYGDGGGGGDGGDGELARAKFSQTYNLEGAPSWWRGFTPDTWNPESEYMSMVNAVIPFLSPEDQRAAAQSLARMYPEFAGYGADANPGYAAAPTEIGAGTVNQYLSASRSQNILNALQAMATASGRKMEDFGPGYNYFKQLASTIGNFGASGPGDGVTRTEYQQMMSQLDPLLAESSGGSLGAYGSIARMLANPYFSAGQLGNVIFGNSNAQFF